MRRAEEWWQKNGEPKLPGTIILAAALAEGLHVNEVNYLLTRCQ
jgi:hypothetical protein